MMSTTSLPTLSLHDALPIFDLAALAVVQRERLVGGEGILARALALTARSGLLLGGLLLGGLLLGRLLLGRLLLGRLLLRSEERRVGKECIARRSRSR